MHQISCGKDTTQSTGGCLSKSGKTSFYQKAVSQSSRLNKGTGVSFDHFKKEMMKQIFAMKLSGKPDQEILDYINSLIEGEKKK